MNFLEILKECFQIRGELQNDTITGVNSDEQNLMKKNVNRVVKEIADMHPPFLQAEFTMNLKEAVSLVSSGTATATGTSHIPELLDSNSNLAFKNKYWQVSDGTYRRRVIGVTGTTYKLDQGLFASATTATTWKAYKDVYPVPHNLGHVHNIFYESGEIEIDLVPRVQFQAMQRRNTTGSEPNICSFNVFKNKWANEKSSEASATVSSGSNLLIVGDSTYYDEGDVLRMGTSTTYFLHTVSGKTTSTTGVYLDRDWNGTQTAVSVTVNPNEFTEYLSFYWVPDTNKEIKLYGYIKPEDMVANTDVCVIPDYLCPAVIVGALLRDKIGREMLTEQWVAWYDRVIKLLRQKKDARVYQKLSPPDGFYNSFRGKQANDYNFSPAGIT